MKTIIALILLLSSCASPVYKRCENKWDKIAKEARIYVNENWETLKDK